MKKRKTKTSLTDEILLYLHIQVFPSAFIVWLAPGIELPSFPPDFLNQDLCRELCQLHSEQFNDMNYKILAI